MAPHGACVHAVTRGDRWGGGAAVPAPGVHSLGSKWSGLSFPAPERSKSILLDGETGSASA